MGAGMIDKGAGAELEYGTIVANWPSVCDACGLR